MITKKSILLEQPGDGWVSLGSGSEGKDRAANISDPELEKKEVGGIWYVRRKGTTSQKQEPVVKKQEPIKSPEPVKKQMNVSDLDPQYQPNVQYIIPNKNTSNVQPNQPNKAPDKVTFTRITHPNDD